MFAIHAVNAESIAIDVLAFLLVVAVAFGVLTLVSSFIRFHLLADRMEQAGAEDNVDPKDLFRLRVVRELGVFHQVPAPFSLFLVAPTVPPDFGQSVGADAISEACDLLFDRLRSSLRETDAVVRVDEAQFGVVGLFPAGRAVAIAERVGQNLSGATMHMKGGRTFRWPVAIGAASYPEHGERAAELIEATQEALTRAKAQGPGGIFVQPLPEAPPQEEEPATKPVPDGLLDPLTGVLRRDRFTTALQKKCARRIKEGQGVSVLYLSVDHFEQYRDHYGAAATDLLLKGIADILSRFTRETDILARTADHEFSVVMDGAPDAGLTAAQRLVQIVKRAPFRMGATSLKSTVSVGVAGYPGHTSRALDMWSFAETAMLAARERGANVALLYQSQMKNRRKVDVPVDRF